MARSFADIITEESSAIQKNSDAINIIKDVDELNNIQKINNKQMTLLQEKVANLSKELCKLANYFIERTSPLFFPNSVIENASLSTLNENLIFSIEFDHIIRLAYFSECIANNLQFFSHSYSVGVISEALYRLNTDNSNSEATFFGFGAMLHDLGNMLLPAEILCKKGALKEAEIEVMKEHTKLGYKYLANSPSKAYHYAAICSLNHHERWNGSGYPSKLSGENIPLEGRILAIADAFSIINKFTDETSPDKLARKKAEQRTLFVKNKGILFDPKLVDSMLEHYDDIYACMHQGQILAENIMVKLNQNG